MWQTLFWLLGRHQWIKKGEFLPSWSSHSNEKDTLNKQTNKLDGAECFRGKQSRVRGTKPGAGIVFSYKFRKGLTDKVLLNRDLKEAGSKVHGYWGDRSGKYNPDQENSQAKTLIREGMGTYGKQEAGQWVLEWSQWEEWHDMRPERI